MKILFLSPQPFYQERGTTIAIDLMLKSLSERGDEVDLLTFHLGEERTHTGMTLKRIRPLFAPKSIDPGFSWRKVYCDFFLLCAAFGMMRKERYDLIYAVEEAGFIAMVLRRFFGVPYVFDMDSSMSAQILERFPWLRPLAAPIHWLETLPMRRAVAVVPMCEDLAVRARQYSDGLVHVLKDVSLLAKSRVANVEDLRAELGIDGPLLMYVGNLVGYQGIDLLLESFAELQKTHPAARLVIVGGTQRCVSKYRGKAEDLGVGGETHLIGPRPVDALGDYLKQADILISPRIHGTNTPMKIYSYLDSGVVVVATALPAHTQVMSKNEAALTPPRPASMATTVTRLLDAPAERKRLAGNAQSLIRREHSWTTFNQNVNFVFGEVESRLEPARSGARSSGAMPD